MKQGAVAVSDADARVRYPAVVALRTCGRASSVPVLLSVAQHAALDGNITAAALDALGTLGSAENLAEIGQYENLPAPIGPAAKRAVAAISQRAP